MLARLAPALAVFAALAFAPPALADEFHVNSTGPGTGTCTGGPVWDCTTLQAAVVAANANNAEDVIFLEAPGEYAPGPLTLGDDVSIFGLGARVTQIDGGEDVRVIDVVSGVTATLGNLTIQNGNAGSGDGGNIRNAGALSLIFARVTNGEAGMGGGIANEPGATLSVANSLIDSNVASGAGGGGISSSGGPVADPNPADVQLLDSTIGLNLATTGGGILSTGGSNTVGIDASTIAKNIAGGGIAINNGNTVELTASLVAGNNGGNCPSASKPGDLGFNLEDANTCGLDAGNGSKVNTDPGLSAGLADAGGQTNVFTFAATSPAVDMVKPCTFPYDQRFFLRVATFGQDPCDAGAYEQSGAGTLISSSPPPTTTAGSATFAFAAADETATFVCQLTGPGHPGGFVPCTSPTTYTGLAPGTYVFSVAVADINGQPSTIPATRTFTVTSPPAQTPTPTPTATPVATPTPVPQKDATGKPSGTVLIKLPGGKFVAFDPSQPIPSGSEIDVTHGRITLTAKLTPGGKPQTATFYDGIFKLTLGKKTTDLTLSQPLAKCSRGAAASAKKAKTRKLWGDGSGSFRTRGQYSAATVRGTKWLVQDSCAGTLTKVSKGVVSVFDQVKKRTIVLRAGKSYLAKPRR